MGGSSRCCQMDIARLKLHGWVSSDFSWTLLSADSSGAAAWVLNGMWAADFVILKGAHLAASDGMCAAQRLADGCVVSWSFVVQISQTKSLTLPRSSLEFLPGRIAVLPITDLGFGIFVWPVAQMIGGACPLGFRFEIFTCLYLARLRPCAAVWWSFGLIGGWTDWHGPLDSLNDFAMLGLHTRSALVAW
ncbi:hypothetical protein ACLOJK_022952 [Asimina triloba]